MEAKEGTAMRRLARAHILCHSRDSGRVRPSSSLGGLVWRDMNDALQAGRKWCKITGTIGYTGA